jgi:GST-like protein
MSVEGYICEEYSIADIANWTWVRIYFWSGVNIEGLDNLVRWMKQMEERPACKKGIEIPKRESSKKLVNSVKNILQT